MVRNGLEQAVNNCGDGGKGWGRKTVTFIYHIIVITLRVTDSQREVRQLA